MHHRASILMVDVLTSCVLVGGCLAGAADTSPISSYEAQAVYLYNLAKFVRWPAEAAHETVTICIAGPEASVDALKKVVAAQGPGIPPAEVRSVGRPEQEEGCNILFLESSTREHADEWLAASTGKSALTVSDLSDFLDRGGMIQLEPGEDRVRFSVDLRPVTRSGLSLSSELLKVATAVRGASGDGGTP